MRSACAATAEQLFLAFEYVQIGGYTVARILGMLLVLEHHYSQVDVLFVGRSGRQLRSVKACIAVGNVLGMNITDVLVPYQGEVRTRRLERRCVYSLAQVFLDGLAGIGQKPRLVQVFRRIIFSKSPFAVNPHFVPVVVAAVVVPRRSASHT